MSEWSYSAHLLDSARFRGHVHLAEHDAGQRLVVRMPLFLELECSTDIYLALFLSSLGKGFFFVNYLSYNVTTKFYAFIMNPLTILGKKYKIKIIYNLIPQK